MIFCCKFDFMLNIILACIFICEDTRWISPSMYPLLTFVKISVWIKNMYQVKLVPIASLMTFDVVMLYIQIFACCLSRSTISENISNFSYQFKTFETNFRYIIGSLIYIVRPLYTNSRSSFASHYASHFVQGMLLFI